MIEQAGNFRRAAASARGVLSSLSRKPRVNYWKDAIDTAASGELDPHVWDT